MDERVLMLNFVTGTEMSVPAQLVQMYLSAGHKRVEQKEEKKEAKAKQKRKAG